MKLLFSIAFLLLITVSGNAQQAKHEIGFMKLSRDKITVDNSFKGFTQAGKEAWTWKTYSDTIELAEPLNIHFIKIGANVYQISQPAPEIKKVEGGYIFGQFQPYLHIIPDSVYTIPNSGGNLLLQ